MKNKQLSLILGSALIVGSSAATDLVINGDFETGISGAGYAGAGYSNEVGTYLPEAPGNPAFIFTNRSDWVIENPSATANSAKAGFTDLETPKVGWGVKLGNYSDSTVTYNALITLEAGAYIFSADHWGTTTNGSEFTAKLVNVDSGLDIMIGSFEDTTPGVQNSAGSFEVLNPGKYKLVLFSTKENTNNAWLDNVSIYPMP